MRDLKEKTPLLQKTYQIILRIYDYVGKFPRAQKPVLGNKILETAIYILEKVMDASYLQADDKKRALEEYDLSLKRLLLFLRLAKDLSFLSHKGYEYLCREITDMGRMVGGWQKWQVKEKEKRKSSVVFTTESPLIKRYLELKTRYPHQVIGLKVGTFYRIFFKDAHYFQKRYGFKLRNLAAPSSGVKIESCGFPVSSATKYKKEVENLKLFDYDKVC